MATITDRAPTSNFCQLCTAMFEQTRPFWDRDEACKLKSLKESAQDGCPMCNWLWNSIPLLSRLEIDDISFYRRDGSILRQTNSRASWFEWSEFAGNIQAGAPSDNGVTGGIGDTIPRYGAIGVRAPFETNILSTSYRAPVNTGESETFDLARQWMHNCISSHVSCAAYRRPDWAPTRLLKLLPKVDGKISAKLEERDKGHYSNTVEYIALSHRWLGDDESPLLSEENRPQFRENIEVSRLKASIRDAICATVRLGLYYLWVDTLCVLQDNKDDKTHEIGRMDSIYSNAQCTIAAGVGETADEGCFTSRDANQVRTHGVHLRLGEDESHYCLLRLSWAHTNKEVDDTSLARRGWTFQERFLSPRTLHFCAKQVHWECREFRANETHPGGNPTHMNWHWDIKFAGMGAPWSKIIESYTARLLTFPADRLRAIQGVADFVQRNSTATGQPDKYLHGLWRSSLPLSLLWISKYLLKHRGLTGVAPTWSWASTNEEITFPYLDLREYDPPLIEILGVSDGSDIHRIDTGRDIGTKDDAIMIRGRVYRSPRHWEEDSWFPPRVHYDTYEGAEQIEAKARNEYLPIYKRRQHVREGIREGPRDLFRGIVVRALGGDALNRYERVGTYSQEFRLDVANLSFGNERDIYLH